METDEGDKVVGDSDTEGNTSRPSCFFALIDPTVACPFCKKDTPTGIRVCQILKNSFEVFGVTREALDNSRLRRKFIKKVAPHLRKMSSISEKEFSSFSSNLCNRYLKLAGYEIARRRLRKTDSEVRKRNVFCCNDDGTPCTAVLPCNAFAPCGVLPYINYSSHNVNTETLEPDDVFGNGDASYSFPDELFEL